jgi:hypothetical protein
MNKIYHFIFGLSEDFINKPFCYFHYLNIKSCYLTQNKPKILIHCVYEPHNNEWWEKIKDFVEIVKYKQLPDLVYFCNNQKVWRFEHQSDILRLLILKDIGGVYADIDTFFYKPFFPHFDNKSFVMGLEGMHYLEWDTWNIHGLCNALIISEKSHEFIDIWLEEYKTSYDNCDWNVLSVRKPYELSQKYQNLIHVEPAYTFHKYSWIGSVYDDFTDYNSFYVTKLSDCGIMSKHLFESKIFDRLKDITADEIKIKNSLFARMCKNVEGLL